MPPTAVLAAVAGIVIVAALGRITLRSWLHPGAFFALCWLFLVIFSLSGPLFGVEQYRVWDGAVWWIVLTLICVYVGSLVGTRMAGPVRTPIRIPTSGQEFEYIVPLLAASAVGSVVWPIEAPTFTTSGDHPPLYLQVFLGLHYLGAVLGGLLFAGSREARYRLLALATFLPGLFLAVMMTGRTTVVLLFCYWFTGYFAMMVFVRRGRPVGLFSRGRMLAAVGLIAFLLVIAVVFTQFRSVPNDVPIAEKAQRYWSLLEADRLLDSWEWMHSGIFGHVAMFSAYFELAWADPPSWPKFPEQTGAGIYRALGYSLPEPLYVDVGGLPTNIFTIFKPPIEDFTMPGALLIFFGWGAMSGWAYRKVQRGSLWPAVLLAHYYANSTNIGGTFLTYNSQTGTFIIVGLYLWYLETRGPLRPPVATSVENSVRPVLDRTSRMWRDTGVIQAARARFPRNATMRPVWGAAPSPRGGR